MARNWLAIETTTELEVPPVEPVERDWEFVMECQPVMDPPVVASERKWDWGIPSGKLT